MKTSIRIVAFVICGVLLCGIAAGCDMNGEKETVESPVANTTTVLPTTTVPPTTLPKPIAEGEIPVRNAYSDYVWGMHIDMEKIERGTVLVLQSKAALDKFIEEYLFEGNEAAKNNYLDDVSSYDEAFFYGRSLVFVFFPERWEGEYTFHQMYREPSGRYVMEVSYKEKLGLEFSGTHILRIETDSVIVGDENFYIDLKIYD